MKPSSYEEFIATLVLTDEAIAYADEYFASSEGDSALISTFPDKYFYFYYYCF